MLAQALAVCKYCARFASRRSRSQKERMKILQCLAPSQILRSPSLSLGKRISQPRKQHKSLHAGAAASALRRQTQHPETECVALPSWLLLKAERPQCKHRHPALLTGPAVLLFHPIGRTKSAQKDARQRCVCSSFLRVISCL